MDVKSIYTRIFSLVARSYALSVFRSETPRRERERRAPHAARKCRRCGPVEFLATLARTGGNLLRRGEHATLIRSPAPAEGVSRESRMRRSVSRARAREDRDAVRWFFKELPPRPSSACFPLRGEGSRTNGGTLLRRERATRASFSFLLCAVAPPRGAAVRAYTRARGQADRRAETLETTMERG